MGFREYVDYLLPREVVGPVLLVFSLEGVIDGIFGLLVPKTYTLLGWVFIFLITLLVIGYWGEVDDEETF